ncbi:MAG: NAD(+) diphosphatase [Deltaproteobacteria bacterium]
MDYSFAFEGSVLQRAAELRASNAPALDPRARSLVLWRGKLLVGSDNQPFVALLDTPAFEIAREPVIFLGIGANGPRFGIDLSSWTPPEDAATIGEFVDASEQRHPDFPDARFVEVRGIMSLLGIEDAECIATARALTSWHASHRFCAACGQPSIVAQSGWQRNCPACNAQHFPRTDPVVIMAITRGDKLLLGRGPTWPERMYSCLAGFVEPGEPIEAAVRRETLEEAGITVGKVTYVASQPWPFPMSLMFGCLGEALSDDITLDVNELADARWFDRTEVMHILAGIHPDVAQPRKGAIAGYLIERWASDQLGAA